MCCGVSGRRVWPIHCGRSRRSLACQGGCSLPVLWDLWVENGRPETLDIGSMLLILFLIIIFLTIILVIIILDNGGRNSTTRNF